MHTNSVFRLTCVVVLCDRQHFATSVCTFLGVYCETPYKHHASSNAVNHGIQQMTFDRKYPGTLFAPFKLVNISAGNVRGAGER